MQVPDSVFFDIINKPVKRSKRMLWLICTSDTVLILPVSASQQQLAATDIMPRVSGISKWFVLIVLQFKKLCNIVNYSVHDANLVKQASEGSH